MDGNLSLTLGTVDTDASIYTTGDERLEGSLVRASRTYPCSGGLKLKGLSPTLAYDSVVCTRIRQ